MKKIFIFLLTIISIHESFAQFTPYQSLVFEGFTPKWSHTTIDSSRIMVGEHSEASDFWAKKIFISNSNLYKISDVKSIWCTGGAIEKIDPSTGEVLWKSIYDINIQDRIESPQYVYTNEDGNIEIVNYRIFDPESIEDVVGVVLGIYPMHLSVRTYDQHTGTLLAHDYPADTDTTAYSFKVLSNKPEVFFFTPHTEDTYLKIHKDNTLGTQYYYTNLLTKDGYLIDSLYQTDIGLPSTTINAQSSRQAGGVLVNDDGNYITFDVKTDPKTAEAKISLKVYNPEWEVIKNFDTLLEDYLDYYPRLIRLLEVKDNHILLRTAEEINGNTRRIDFVLIDIEEGRIIERVKAESEIGGFYGVATATLVNDEQQILVVASNSTIISLDILLSDGNSNLSLVKSHPIQQGDKEIRFSPLEVQQNNNGDIIINGDYAIKDEELDGSFIFHANYTAYINADTLGLVTSLSEISNTKDDFFQITPNPAHSTIQIASESDFDRCEIYDIQGQLVQIFEFDSTSNKTIDLSNQLANGSYVLKTINSSSHQINSQKLIIQKF